MRRYGLISVLVLAMVCPGSAYEAGTEPDDGTGNVTDDLQNPIGTVSTESSGDEVRKAGHAFELAPGVIVDPDRPAVYVMNPRHGIDAVDLSSGKLIWSTTKAAKPLLLHGDLLVAQADVRNGLRIVTLNTKNAGELALAADIQLPNGVRASIDEGMGTSFRASARIHNGNLLVSWISSDLQMTGATPEPGMKPLDRQMAGVVRIDLETRRVDQLGTDEVFFVPVEPALPKNVAGLVESGALPGPLWRTGRVLAALERSSADGTERIVLRRWDVKTGERLSDLALFSTELTVRFASADGRHLLASKLVDPAASLWTWSIYSLETGRSVGEVCVPSPAGAFFICGSSLIYESLPHGRFIDGRSIEEPAKLRAVDLDTSTERWNWALRETAYRGSYPPAPPISPPNTPEQR